MTFQPGVSGNPGGKPKDKPFTDALRMEACALANGELNTYPKGSWRQIAQALLLKAGEAECAQATMVVERMEGKIPQAIGGTDDLPSIIVQVARDDKGLL